MHIYLGLHNETNPKDVTHGIIDDGVSIIKQSVFYEYFDSLSVIIWMVMSRELKMMLYSCSALRFIRLSKRLECTGGMAFCSCYIGGFLPSTGCQFDWKRCILFMAIIEIAASTKQH